MKIENREQILVEWMGTWKYIETNRSKALRILSRREDTSADTLKYDEKQVMGYMNESVVIW